MATTKLLLLEDVHALGRAGDLVSVKNGHARNYLTPKGLAVVATKYTLRRQKQLQEERLKKAAEDKHEAEAVATKLEGCIVDVRVKVDPEGHMYGSVSVMDIVHLVEEQHGVVLTKNNIVLEHPLKQTGVHTINIKLPEEVTTTIQVKALSEEASAEEVVAETAEEAEEATEE